MAMSGGSGSTKKTEYNTINDCVDITCSSKVFQTTNDSQTPMSKRETVTKRGSSQWILPYVPLFRMNQCRVFMAGFSTDCHCSLRTDRYHFRSKNKHQNRRTLRWRGSTEKICPIVLQNRRSHSDGGSTSISISVDIDFQTEMCTAEMTQDTITMNGLRLNTTKFRRM